MPFAPFKEGEARVRLHHVKYPGKNCKEVKEMLKRASGASGALSLDEDDDSDEAQTEAWRNTPCACPSGA